MLCNILCQYVYVYIYKDVNDLIVADHFMLLWERILFILIEKHCKSEKKLFSCAEGAKC